MPQSRRRPALPLPLLPARFVGTVRRFFRAYEADESDARRFRARQLEALLRLTPLAMAVNVLNVVVIDFSVWDTAPTTMIASWSLTILIMAYMGVRGWVQSRARAERATASRRALRHAAIQAGLLGAVWGLLPALLFPVIDIDSKFYVGLVVTGMICAGGFALTSVPVAATSYVVCIGVGSVIALWYSGLEYAHLFSLLLFAYCGIVIHSVWTMAKTIGARLVAEAHAERQNEVIGLLLKDFEDHASDLLWELDARGRFAHVSVRLAQVLGVTAERLATAHAWAVLRRRMPDDDTGVTQWAALRSHVTDRRAFRDLHVSITHEGRRTWWALSARPLFDELGQVTGWRGVATDITDKHDAFRKLSWLANNDSLTGLVNRHQFRELLQTLLQGPAPVGPLAVVCFDLDDFKRINDSRGHAAGDRLLAIFGQRLLAAARRSDTVARLGGDEFAMVLRGATGEDEVRSLLDRLLASLDEPCDVLGQPEQLRVSIGVALAPADGHDVDTLLNHADLALYAAKDAGGHRWCLFHAALADTSRRRLALSQALLGAIERDEFRLVYQPQIDAEDQHISGFEALLRWEHAEHGSVSPEEFVPIAEATGMMHEIGDWVLRTACAEAANWPRGVSVSINVSATQLTGEGFVERVAAAAGDLQPSRVELEVTESALIEDADGAVGALRKLRQLGFRTALDDFGTGYSALGYLRRFPFDTLKIDRSFVRDLSRDGEAQVIVETILAMARALRMRTIAEGVEHPVEAEMLRERGCAAFQGFLVSRPLPAGDVTAFVEGWRPVPLRVVEPDAHTASA
ncbi:MAG: EAL domain-containing protein [Gemmatimonadaceae bacterium]|nr:EAL domain-containing protein [Gemmatimonadaceae bacterium]